MKFAVKMIALVSVLLAISLAVSGYTVVRSALSSDLETAKVSAQEDMKLFGLTLQALCLREKPDQLLASEKTEELIYRMIRNAEALKSYSFRITNAEGKLIAATQEFHKDRDPPQDGMMETYLLYLDRRYYLCTRQFVDIINQRFLIERSTEITELFDRAMRNLRVFELVMLVVLLVGTGVTTGFAMVLTSPIRRISRTSRDLASGRYEKRVIVKSRDELGGLAQDFNHMADALQTKIEELRDTAQRQKEFTASFAHELKTPLTSVIGYADTLRSRTLPKRQQFEAANYIVTEGKRLEAMSFALLDLFSLDQREPAMTACPTKVIADHVKTSTAYILRQSEVQLDIDVEDSTVTAEKDLIISLFYNLIDNARKASQTGQMVVFTGKKTEDGYRFTVQDHGHGIPKEALNKLTEPFYMVDKSRSRAQGGAGLGLALCQKIAVIHGSMLEFQSQEGAGTQVSLVLRGENE